MSFRDALISQWRTYAPNMTRDNLIAVNVIAPPDIEATHPDMREGGYSEGATLASGAAAVSTVLARSNAILD